MISKKSQKRIGVMLFFTFTAFIVSAATAIEISRVDDSTENTEWKNVSTPTELMGKDQWYRKTYR